MNQQEDNCLNNSSCNNNVIVNNELGRQELYFLVNVRNSLLLSLSEFNFKK